MADFLSQMAALSAARAERARLETPEQELRRRIAALGAPRPLPGDRFLLFAECKRASPAAGVLDTSSLTLRQRALQYESGGAAAVSVLTEPSRFQGSLQDLRDISGAVRVPAMRKDFLTDSYQVVEARASGASGVLLIVRMLDREGLREMLSCSAELGMFTLLECFDREDILRCADFVSAGAGRPPGVLLGVNTRDLRDLQVRPGRLEELAGDLPRCCARIAESGMESPDDVAHAARAGYTGALVGSALMRAGDPSALCRAMLDAATAALTRRGDA